MRYRNIEMQKVILTHLWLLRHVFIYSIGVLISYVHGSERWNWG